MDIIKGIALCGCFVGSFYVWRRERVFVKMTVVDLKEAASNPDMYVDRNSTTTIRRRTISFTVVSVASAVYLLWSSFADGSGLAVSASSVIRQARFGCKSLVLTLLLFAGVLVEQYAEDRLPDLRAYCRADPVRFARDLIICPIGEELFFRGVLFHVVSERPVKAQVAITSLLFALAHVHHVFSFAADAFRCAEEDPSATTSQEAQLRAWRVAWRRVGVLSVVTTAFGILSGLYYNCVCERSLAATTVAHVVCNAVGAPHFSFLQHSTDETQRSWKKWIGAGYIMGIVGSLSFMARTRSAHHA